MLRFDVETGRDRSLVSLEARKGKQQASERLEEKRRRKGNRKKKNQSGDEEEGKVEEGKKLSAI